jgi:predicted nucleic acid-binding protein
METIYLDSSVPSAYYDKRVPWRLEYTQKWWQYELTKYDVFVSSITILEITNTQNEKLRVDLLDLVADFPQLKISSDIEQIANGYLSQKIIPQSSSPDALHMAIASYHKIDFLVTWNCTHLAEGHRRKKIKIFNTSAGLYNPEIVTPMELDKQGIMGGDENALL